MVDDNMRKVLYVYSHFKSEPGEVLDSSHFLGVGRFRHWLASDLDEGIEQARKSGLVEADKRGWRLTNAGFAEAGRHAAEQAPS